MKVLVIKLNSFDQTVYTVSKIEFADGIYTITTTAGTYSVSADTHRLVIM